MLESLIAGANFRNRPRKRPQGNVYPHQDRIVSLQRVQQSEKVLEEIIQSLQALVEKQNVSLLLTAVPIKVLLKLTILSWEGALRVWEC